ncbi:unnamed protein product [Trifolium pratense]|uniref:Uncharacterized protein n=1 Tax=Trifolium pratense TaxID=57577 RepID=A0ACB0J081_TRIPR|nr:unnamed protein product [Trifolium pratense]
MKLSFTRATISNTSFHLFIHLSRALSTSTMTHFLFSSQNDGGSFGCMPPPRNFTYMVERRSYCSVKWNEVMDYFASERITT